MHNDERKPRKRSAQDDEHSGSKRPRSASHTEAVDAAAVDAVAVSPSSNVLALSSEHVGTSVSTGVARTASDDDEQAWLGVAEVLMAQGHEGASVHEVLRYLRAAEVNALQRRQLAEQDAQGHDELQLSSPSEKRILNDAFYADTEEEEGEREEEETHRTTRDSCAVDAAVVSPSSNVPAAVSSVFGTLVLRGAARAFDDCAHEGKQEEDDPPDWVVLGVVQPRDDIAKYSVLQRSQPIEQDTQGRGDLQLSSATEKSSLNVTCYPDTEAEEGEGERGKEETHRTTQDSRAVDAADVTEDVANLLYEADVEEDTSPFESENNENALLHERHIATPVLPLTEAPTRVETQTVLQANTTRNERSRFFRYMARMTEAEAANVMKRYHAFYTAWRRIRDSWNLLQQQDVMRQHHNNEESTFFEHVDGSGVASIPIKDVRVYFSLWFIFKYRQQVLKLPSQPSRQMAWGYFYARLLDIQRIITRVLDSNHPTPFLRQAIQALRTEDDNGSQGGNQYDDNHHDGNQHNGDQRDANQHDDNQHDDSDDQD